MNRAPFKVGSLGISINLIKLSSNHSTQHSYQLCTFYTASHIASITSSIAAAKTPRSATPVAMCGGIFSAIFYEIFELWDMVLLGVGHIMVKTGL